jgi:hypothetical protein
LRIMMGLLVKGSMVNPETIICLNMTTSLARPRPLADGYKA